LPGCLGGGKGFIDHIRDTGIVHRQIAHCAQISQFAAGDRLELGQQRIDARLRRLYRCRRQGFDLRLERIQPLASRLALEPVLVVQQVKVPAHFAQQVCCRLLGGGANPVSLTGGRDDLLPGQVHMQLDRDRSVGVRQIGERGMDDRLVGATLCKAAAVACPAGPAGAG